MCSKMQSWASMDMREGGSEKAAGTISHEKGSFQVWVKSGWIIRCLKWGLWPAKAQFDVYLKRARDVYEKQIFAEKISYGAIRSVFIFGRSHERVGFQFGNFFYFILPIRYGKCWKFAIETSEICLLMFVFLHVVCKIS